MDINRIEELKSELKNVELEYLKLEKARTKWYKNGILYLKSKFNIRKDTEPQVREYVCEGT